MVMPNAICDAGMVPIAIAPTLAAPASTMFDAVPPTDRRKTNAPVVLAVSVPEIASVLVARICSTPFTIIACEPYDTVVAFEANDAELMTQPAAKS